MPVPRLATQIDVFKALKYQMQLIGILELPLPIRYQKVSIKIIQRILVITLFVINILQCFAFLLTEAKELGDFVELICFTAVFITDFFWYLISVWSDAKIEEFFETVQRTINERNNNYLTFSLIL